MAIKPALSPVIPSELQPVHRQFEQWRRTCQPGGRIPAPLWAAAVAAARRHGVYRTARLLHLESQKLKRLMGAARLVSRVPAAAEAPTFVELVAPGGGSSGACTIEIEGPRGGRLRVQLRGGTPPDLVALSQVVWGHAG
jgi:hypothetical protein